MLDVVFSLTSLNVGLLAKSFDYGYDFSIRC